MESPSECGIELAGSISHEVSYSFINLVISDTPLLYSNLHSSAEENLLFTHWGLWSDPREGRNFQFLPGIGITTDGWTESSSLVSVANIHGC